MLKYHRFHIEKYKAIKDSAVSVLNEPVPLIGVNESGKSSALEAAARFDHRNDTVAEQKGWKFINRYMPNETAFSVSADIAVDDVADVEVLLDGYAEAEKEEVMAAMTALAVNQTFPIRRHFRKSGAGFSFSYALGNNESPTIERFCRDVVASLPRIFYFDNFLENQFPDKIDFPPEYFSNPDFVLSEYQSIVEGMFDEAGVSLKSFLDEPDENTKQTQIEEVNRVTTNRLIGDWTAMHIGSAELDIGNMSDLAINLQQDRVNAHAISVSMMEKFKDENGIDRTTSMLLSERSLGFRWFFNFSAKKSYGARGAQKFVYLFDEPGSYLHNGAQDILAKAIRDLAKDHPVIFSTHSEFLLDPSLINISNIRIVEKTDRQIKLRPLSEMSEKRTMGALSTLYNALRMKVPVSSTLNQKVMVTEGITDYYFWKMLIKDVVLLPGFGAGQNEYLISIAIGTSKKYTAAFDGDVAGEQAIQKYTRFFGEHESAKWYKYKKANGDDSCLEELLSEGDRERLKTMTGMHDLKKAMPTLFFSESPEVFWNGIDAETKDNLKANARTLRSLLGLSATDFNYQLGNQR